MRFAGLKNIQRSILNFILKIFEVALSWRHHDSRIWRWKQEIFF